MSGPASDSNGEGVQSAATGQTSSKFPWAGEVPASWAECGHLDRLVVSKLAQGQNVGEAHAAVELLLGRELDLTSFVVRAKTLRARLGSISEQHVGFLDRAVREYNAASSGGEQPLELQRYWQALRGEFLSTRMAELGCGTVYSPLATVVALERRYVRRRGVRGWVSKFGEEGAVGARSEASALLSALRNLSIEDLDEETVYD